MKIGSNMFKSVDLTETLRQRTCWDWDDDVKEAIPREVATRDDLPDDVDPGKHWYIEDEKVVVVRHPSEDKWVTVHSRPGIR